MKRILLLELCFLFLATTFQSDRMTGWVQQTIPRQDLIVRDLQFLDSLTGFIVQSRYSPDTSFISKTTDGGNSWISTQFINQYFTSLNFVNNNTGYCVGREGPPYTPGVIFKTTNGGINWFISSYVTNFILLNDVFFVNTDTGWVCSSLSVGGGLWRTINGGSSWQIQMGESFSPSKIFFINSNTGWVIGNVGELYKTTNCGMNWFFQKLFDDATDIFFTTPDTGWIIGTIIFSDSNVNKSTDGGYNWFSVNNPVIVSESRLHFIDNNKGWAGSVFNKIFATKDGYNWGKQYSPIWRSDNLWAVDSLHGWAGYGGLVHTVDGGGPTTRINNQNEPVVKDYILYQNYPNPFNAKSNIKYKISKSSNIKINVFDISGKEIIELVNKNQSEGIYEVIFDGGNLSSGIYFYSLYANGVIVDTKKLILLK